MDNSLIPADVKIAAKRGFIRTTYQAYAAVIPTGGISATAIAALVEGPNPMLFVFTAIAVLISPPLAGLASYLSITSKGIPGDYVPETTAVGQVVTQDGRAIDPASALSK